MTLKKGGQYERKGLRECAILRYESGGPPNKIY